jgi:hypothetical protein
MGSPDMHGAGSTRDYNSIQCSEQLLLPHTGALRLRSWCVCVVANAWALPLPRCNGKGTGWHSSRQCATRRSPALCRTPSAMAPQSLEP